ncbi:hypothetical protein [Ureibacillus thermosphaericus]|uniref:hypothetical protein n=1 Tax=Ureibacillus thermosphaericus TaxID=51173 RepID=UPI0030C94E29
MNIKEGKFGDVDVTVLPDLDTKELLKENDQLKKLLGEKNIEIAILQNLIKMKNLK